MSFFGGQNLDDKPFADEKTLVESYFRNLIILAGWDDPSNSPHMAETALRVFRFWKEFSNRTVDLDAILKDGFENEDPHAATGGMVVQKNIPFRGLCAHHLLPFVGRAAIGYLPRDRVVGLSKMARLVDACGTKEPSTQEAITNEIADVMEGLNGNGTIVVTTAVHMCMVARGINAPGTETTCSAIRGNFIHSPGARQEFFALVGGFNA